MSDFIPPMADQAPASSVRIERVAPSGKVARKLSVTSRDTEEEISAMREMAVRQFILLDRAARDMEA